MIRYFITTVLLCSLANAECINGLANDKQCYGYVQIREGAHMFWWVFYSRTSAAEKPLILWLSGGPGGSSTGHGNFKYIGPLNEKLQPRDSTWVNDFNVLFVDSPVGSGYSYVENLSYLSINNEEIAQDTLELLKGFYKAAPEFKTTKLYVYGDGYGAKLAVNLVDILLEAVKNGSIEANIVGLAMGNAWVSPIDAVLSYAPYLYELSLIDENGRLKLMQQAEFAKRRYDEENYYHATLEWIRTLEQIGKLTDGVDYNNVLTKIQFNVSVDSQRTFTQKVIDQLTYSKYHSEEANVLSELMNGPMKDMLNISKEVLWGYQSEKTFESLYMDIMKPVTDIIQRILNETTIEVHICNGNLDLIADTPGQFLWINELDWVKSHEFHSAPRIAIWVNDIMEGYKKQGGGLSFYWINVAGIDFITENTVATRHFLKTMTGF